MTTREIAQHLARAASLFPWLGTITEESLCALVETELGHREILDQFQSYSKGGHLAKAIAKKSLLHIVSGNTPHGALQSLIRGLLVGAHNRCKLPSSGLPEVEAFRSALPPALAARIELTSTLPDSWLENADVVIVFGSDATISFFQARVLPHQRFIPHGHRISLGVIFDDPEFQSVDAAAADSSLFDQQGCLSPHLFYVQAAIARRYAEALAGAMARFHEQTPRGLISLEEQTAIAALREEYRFKAALNPETALWESQGSTAWTVIYDPDPTFRASCLNRTIFVKPFLAPEEIQKLLHPIRSHLSTIALFPASLPHAEQLCDTGVKRLCRVGKMQSPPLTWHHDGEPVLLPLVEWIDFEEGEQDAPER